MSVRANKYRIQQAVADLRRHLAAAGMTQDFHTAVVLGSGLGAAGESAVSRGGLAVDYAQIAGMPQPVVPGHAGRLIAGAGPLDGVLFFQGRVHWYEGYAVDDLTFPVDLAAETGISNFIVSNAAGGIRSGFQPGDLMLIDGHLTFCDVQHRAAADSGRPSKVIREHLWNPSLRQLGHAVSTPLTVHSGVYAMMAGPNYETPAEVRMLAGLGADAVGMSTVPEALAAADRGIRVLGVSCITNVACGLSDDVLSHDDVSRTAARVEVEFTAWLMQLLTQLTGSSEQHRA